jgi:CCR4-NOT transcription complex subunit 9
MQQQQQGGDSAAALIKLVQELIHHKHRERALLELSKKREARPDLAPILWHR